MARPPRRHPDALGLRRAPGWRVLSLIVAAMAFLAALAIAGAQGAAELGRHWQHGAAATLTVQVPRPGAAPAAPAAQGETRRDRVLALLRGTPGIAAVRALGDAELSDLLRPWLGGSAEQLALPLPAVIAVTVTADGPDLPALAARLEAAAPGTLAESHDPWVRRLALLAGSLRASALLALLLVALVAGAVIVVATGAALASRREVVEILHGLGATDLQIADRFARRASRAAALGGVGGLVMALPVVVVLTALAAPFVGAVPSAAMQPGWGLPGWAELVATVPRLPPLLLWALPSLPLIAAAIGYVAAQGAVRAWLRHLP